MARQLPPSDEDHMTNPAEPPVKHKDTPAPPGPHVAVVGGGLAGLSAALRLAQRGFAVEIYEAKHTLGGNLAAIEVNGVFHDVYPHMFCNWYANFWEVFGEIKGPNAFEARKNNFDPRDGVKLQDPHSTDYLELQNGTTVSSILANLNSGVESFPDMFLVGFSMLDLAATPFQRTGADLLERLDVNGFIYSRGYSTEKVAALQNYILMVIWSIQSNVTAAASYQDFIKHSMAFPHQSPFCWMLEGSLYERVIEPFENKLWSLGCGINKGHLVSNVALDKTGAPILTVVDEMRSITPGECEGDAGEPIIKEIRPDYVVMATPGPVLATLAMAGTPGERLVDAVPTLSELRRFRGEAIPVVDIYFKRKLKDVPKEQVALKQSDADLTFLDISQLWTGYSKLEGVTALVVAASNSYALTSDDDKVAGFQIIQKLHDDYLPSFNPGKSWGDPDSDIDWEKTLYRSNEENRLFVNDVGSWQWRPVASYPALKRVFIAGDFCQTDVDMATVEAAIQSGVAAAAALQAYDGSGRDALRGDPIVPARHEIYSDAVFLAIKLALLPFAYAATAWAALVDEAPLIARTGADPKAAATAPTSVAKTSAASSTAAAAGPKATASAPMSKAAPQNSYSPLTYSLLLPVAFTLDWWKTAYWLVRKLDPDTPGDSDGDATIGLIGYTRTLAQAAIDYVNNPEADAKPDLAGSLEYFTRQAARTAKAGLSEVGKLYDPDLYRRWWRAKR
jgi:hypothetical protein